MDSSKRSDYKLQYPNVQQPSTFSYLQHGGPGGTSGIDCKQSNNLLKSAPYLSSQNLPDQYFKQQLSQQYKLEPSHIQQPQQSSSSYSNLNQTPQPMNPSNNKMMLQSSPQTYIRYNTSSSQSQYNYPDFNTPQKKHSASIAGDLNPNPYQMQTNPFLGSHHQFPPMMMPQTQQQQMDMFNMMQMFGMLRMPQAHNFDSHFSEMHKNLQNVQKKISQMQKDKPQPPAYYPGSAPGINSWQEMMMSQQQQQQQQQQPLSASYNFPHATTHPSPYITQYNNIPPKYQKLQNPGISSLNQERKQDLLLSTSSNQHQSTILQEVQQNKPKQNDIQINDLRPPTSIGVRPPQQEMLQKFDFKYQHQPHNNMNLQSGCPAGPQSQNLAVEHHHRLTNNNTNSTTSKLQQQYIDQKQQNKQKTEQQRVITIPPSKNKHDQIPCARPQTFQQILKKNLDNAVKQDDNVNDEARQNKNQPKRRNYLKRNSRKVISKVPTDQKKYTYYLANFSSEVKDPRFDFNSNFKKRNMQEQNNFEGVGFTEDEATKKQQNPKKEKQFLKRGGGTGGGKSASAARDQKNLIKAQVADKKHFLKQQEQKYQLQQMQDEMYERRNVQKRGSEVKRTKKKLDIFEKDDEDDDYDSNDEEEYEQKISENRIMVAPRSNYQAISKNKQNGLGKLSGLPLPRSYLNQDDDDIEQIVGQEQDEKQMKNRHYQKEDDDDDDEDEDDEQVDYRNPSSKSNEPTLLVKNYFIKKTQKASQIKKAAQSKKDKQSSNHSQETNDFQKQIIHSKIQQTQLEVKKLKRQNEVVKKQQQQLRKGLQKLAKDRAEFQQWKKEEMLQLQEYKASQIKKMKKQKKVMERQIKALNSQPNRKERQEIQKLKKEVSELNELLKTKQQRNKMFIERLKRQNEELSIKNGELQLQIKHIESLAMKGNSIKNGKQKQRSNKTSTISTSSAPRYNFTGSLVPPPPHPSKDQQLQQQQQKQQRHQQQQQHGMSMEMQQVKEQVNEQDEMTNGAAISARRMQMSLDQDDQYFTHRGADRNTKKQRVENIDDQDYEVRNEDQDEEDDEQQRDQRQQEDEDDQDDVDDEEDDDQMGQQNMRILNDIKKAEQDAKNRAPKSSEGTDQSFEMIFLQKYHSSNGVAITSQNIAPNGKISRAFSNGKKEIVFNNGVKREIFPDGYTVVYFNNNDIKQTYPDGKVVYFFAEARTTQTTYQDNLQVFKFSNGQIQKHFPDGTKEINFPDGTVKCIFCDGEQESIFPDGTIQRIEQNGVKSIEYSNGQKDILQPDGVRIREFPDGKIRKTFPNGKVETYMKDE